MYSVVDPIFGTTRCLSMCDRLLFGFRSPSRFTVTVSMRLVSLPVGTDMWYIVTVDDSFCVSTIVCGTTVIDPLRCIFRQRLILCCDCEQRLVTGVHDHDVPVFGAVTRLTTGGHYCVWCIVICRCGELYTYLRIRSRAGRVGVRYHVATYLYGFRHSTMTVSTCLCDCVCARRLCLCV